MKGGVRGGEEWLEEREVGGGDEEDGDGEAAGE